MLVPKLVTTLKGYTRAQFTADLTAGVIVGTVALPLAIAVGMVLASVLFMRRMAEVTNVTAFTRELADGGATTPTVRRAPVLQPSSSREHRMARAKPTPGTCAYCGLTVTRQGAARHLSSCPVRQAAIQRAERSRRNPDGLFHLRVQDAIGGQFWLHLEMQGSATLRDLDEYLREIWLECCGHMSQFSIGGWRGDEIPMRQRAASVFHPGLELTHIYDFGTESETRIKMVGVREGRPVTSRPIALLARNTMPAAACIECGASATFLCTECVTEHETWGVLCGEHAQRHPHDEYGEPVRLVNSPRMGLCGYMGPANPPY